MYVSPYVPLPTEIPGNVTTESYLVRLGFIRRVAALHMASLAVLAALMAAPWTWPPLQHSALGVLLVLLAASLLRTLARGAKWEPWVSAALLPLLLSLLAGALAALPRAGWQVWPAAIGLSLAFVYTFACGRDLSFVGMFGISWLGSTAAITIYHFASGASVGDIMRSNALNTGVLFYYVYDLGSLLSRRRLGEEAGAVVDLYRDVLNFFGYVVRSVRHWQRHSIWSR